MKDFNSVLSGFAKTEFVNSELSSVLSFKN